MRRNTFPSSGLDHALCSLFYLCSKQFLFWLNCTFYGCIQYRETFSSLFFVYLSWHGLLICVCDLVLIFCIFNWNVGNTQKHAESLSEFNDVSHKQSCDCEKKRSNQPRHSWFKNNKQLMSIQNDCTI